MAQDTSLETTTQQVRISSLHRNSLIHGEPFALSLLMRTLSPSNMMSYRISDSIFFKLASVHRFQRELLLETPM